MAQTMNKEARRTIVRTYEDVQWFKTYDGPTLTEWRCSVLGTNLSVCRWQTDRDGRPVWINQVEIWTDDGFGGYWHPILTDQQGTSPDTPFQLPWDQVSTGTVADASRDVKWLRAMIAQQIKNGVGA